MFPFLFLSSVFFGLTGPEKPTFWPVSTHMAANFARFILNSKIQLDLLSYFCLFDKLRLEDVDKAVVANESLRYSS